jgi:diguanylate cyclase (GGDEF)-like protein
MKVPRRIYQMLFLILVCSTTGFLNLSSSWAKAGHDLEFILKGWQYRLGDSPRANNGSFAWMTANEHKLEWKETSSLQKFDDRQDDKMIWLRVRLPELTSRDPSLFIHSVDTVFEVYLDQKLVYKFGDLDSAEADKFIGWPWHIIELPREFENKYLYFRIYSNLSEIGVVGDVVLGSQAQHISRIVTQDLDLVILTFLFFFISLLSLLTSVIWREKRATTALGIFSLLIGVWSISQTEMKQLFIDSPLFWIYADLTALYFCPIALFVLIEETYGIKYRKVIRWLRNGFFAFAVGSIGFSLTNIVSLPATIQPFNILIVVGVVVCLFSLIRAISSNDSEARIFTIGLLIFCSFVIFDVINRWNDWQTPVSPYGILLFMFSLGFILRHRFLTVHQLSVLDGLTGVANRHQFDALIEMEWMRARRDSKSLSLVMADIDFFKNYNDTYGHPEGDQCLKRVASTLKTVTRRAGDVVARLGGEEFAILLPGTDRQGALQAAERVRSELKALNIKHQASDVSDRVTLSLGVACLVPDYSISQETLVAAADKALYKAKTLGRDRVCQAENDYNSEWF